MTKTLEEVSDAVLETQLARLEKIHPAEAVRVGQLEAALREVLRLRRLLAKLRNA